MAACWLGGTIGIVRRWRELALQKKGDVHALAHHGAAIAATEAATAQLEQAAQLSDTPVDVSRLKWLALSTRHTIEQTADHVMRGIGRALGPGPLIADAWLARQLADLSIYLRQCHAERDLEALGMLVLAQPSATMQEWPWP